MSGSFLNSTFKMEMGSAMIAGLDYRKFMCTLKILLLTGILCILIIKKESVDHVLEVIEKFNNIYCNVSMRDSLNG